MHLVELTKVVHTLLQEETVLISVRADHDQAIELAIFQALFVFCPEIIQRLVFRDPKLNVQKVVLIDNGHFLDEEIFICLLGFNSTVEVNEFVLPRIFNAGYEYIDFEDG